MSRRPSSCADACHWQSALQPRQYALATSGATGMDGELECSRALGRVLDYYLLPADRADRILYTHRARPKNSARPSQDVSPSVSAAADAQAWLEAEWRNQIWAVAHSV